MGKLSPKYEVCFLIFAALIFMCSASTRRYFIQSRKLSWDDARKHCQLCFKDLVTVTPTNVQEIAENLTSDHWIGLRKNYYYASNSTGNSTDNSTSYTTSSPVRYATSYATSYSTSYWTSSTSNYSTSNSTTNTSMIWSRWADGDRLIFQNWYPGWPVFKSHFPRRDCCSCSCTCPAGPTTTPATTATPATNSRITVATTNHRTPDFTTDDATTHTSLLGARMQNGTIDSTDEPSVTGNTISDSTDEPSVTGTTISDSTDEPSVTGNTISDSTDVYNVTGNTISDSTDVYNVTGNTTDEFADVHNLAGNTTNSTSLWESRMHNGTNDTAEAENATTATPYTTVVTPGTPTLPLEAQCARSPMLFPDVPDPDENYIEDSCVAMLSFGPWVEKNCFELLPYICYDDDLTFETNATSVTNLTSVSATLTWRPVLDVNDYKLEVKGHPEQGRNLTNVTHGLDDLTPGTRYSVHVFPIKCGRDLKAQEFSFTTIPNKVENLTVLSQNETSTLYLRWDKPVGNVDVYRILYSGKKFETNNTHAKVGDLTPGGLYTFTAISVATGPNSTESKESTITVYTKPGQASNLTVSNNTQESLQLSWLRPSGNTTGYRVKALDENNTVRYDQKVKGTKANVTGLPRSQKITLSVVALANDTLEGDNKTTFSYTAPGQISDLFLNSTHDTVSARWKAPSLGKDSHFKIELKMDGSTEESYNTSVRMKKFHGLKTAAKYTVIVYIINGDISGSAVQCSIFTLPLQPTDPRISSHGKDYITFSWTAPANSSTVSYVAEIKSQFYGYHALKVVNNTQYTFTGLNSGTSYSLEVKTKAGENYSLPISASSFTDPDIRQITLSMMCSSIKPLLCDHNDVRKGIFEKLKEHFNGTLRKFVFWEFRQETVN